MSKVANLNVYNSCVFDCYVSSPKDILESLKYDRTYKELRYSQLSDNTIDFFSYAVSPYKLFNLTVRIQEVYCFIDSHSGELIYYRTSQGDYVLLKHYETDTIYLFPLETYFEVCKIVQDLRKAVGTNDGCPENFYDHMDTTPYIVKHNLWVVRGAIVFVTAVAIVGATILLLHLRRKRTKLLP